MDITSGFEPENGGSNPSGGTANMKGSIKILFWAVMFALGATLIVYGTNIWNAMGELLVGVNDEIKIKGPTGPPYVKGPTGPPPSY